LENKLQNLRAKHLRVLDLVLEGKSNVKIAETLGLTPAGVRLIVNAPVFQSRLSRERDRDRVSQREASESRDLTAKELIAQSACMAAEKQISLLGSGNDKIAQVAAMDILDRSGVPKISREDHRSLSATVVLSDAALERMQRVTQDVFDEPLEVPFKE